MKSVLCVGHIVWDVVLHIDGVPEPDHSNAVLKEHSSCGGSAVNTALTLSSFGVPTKVHGSIGNDHYGEKVAEAIEKNGVEPLLAESDTNGTTVVRALIDKSGESDSDPRYLHTPNGLGECGLGHIDIAEWDGVDHVHVTSMSPKICGEVALKAKEDGKTVSFNPTQLYDKNGCNAIVESADLIILNDAREYDIFCDRHDFNEKLEEGKTIIVTHGPDGATVHRHNEEPVHVDGVSPRGDVVDTVGAGDTFIGGLLAEWVESGDPIKATSQGNASGAWSVTEVGPPNNVDTSWINENTV